MSRARVFLALSSAAALAACAVGPAYQRPQPLPGAQGGFVSGSGPLFAASPPPNDWWRLFDDAKLDALVAEALAANRDIAVAAANLAQVRAQLGEARAARLPSTGLSASGERARQPNPQTGRMEEGDSFFTGFDVAYEVDFFGRVKRSVEAAHADAGAAQAALDVTRVAVASETARAYADACAANVQIAVARRTVDLQQQTFDLTKRRLEAGPGTGLDVAGAGALLETARADLPPLEAQRDGALFRLATLIGKPPSQAPASARDCRVIPQVDRAIPTGDGAALLARRPDVRQAERALAAATARIGVATAGLYPSVSLGASVSSTSGKVGDMGEDYQFSLGPLITWSFPNMAAGRARVGQAGAAADAALARFEQANLTALEEAETALNAYGRELERRAALGRAAAQSADAARLARKRYDAGADSFLTVLDAERTRANLDAQLSASEALVTARQIAVFKALGGGWSDAGR